MITYALLNRNTEHSYTLHSCPFGSVIVSAAKNLSQRPFISLRVTALVHQKARRKTELAKWTVCNISKGGIP